MAPECVLGCARLWQSPAGDDSALHLDLIQAAFVRWASMSDNKGALRIGQDVARFGDDRQANIAGHVLDVVL